MFWWLGEAHKEGFWTIDIVLFIDLGVTYEGVFTL